MIGSPVFTLGRPEPDPYPGLLDFQLTATTWFSLLHKIVGQQLEERGQAKLFYGMTSTTLPLTGTTAPLRASKMLQAAYFCT
ncbi:hypothetical protein J6590_009918 [Homalodisca vitripennis]|nr:hypothetical protein J6590_009918 [Homalodisca vitripennis]